MKLQEAFMKRNDLKKKISRLFDELKSVLITEEGETLWFNPEEKLQELVLAQNELYELNVKIANANQANIEQLEHLKYLDEKIRTYTAIRSSLLENNRRHRFALESSTPVVRNLDINVINEALEVFEDERRQIDRELQKKNWQTEV
jgi:cob(I)alamin adenosyltransferase